jgi:DNA-binding NarL/FixJ family response regulator
MKQLLIADDHRLFAEGLQFLLSYSDAYRVVGIVPDGITVLPALRQQPIDILVLDVTMPGQSGIEVAQAVRAEWPMLPILAVSMETDYTTVQAMLRAGATGYCVKTAGQADLLTALATVGRGESYLSDTLRRTLLPTQKQPTPAASPWATLTPREQEVARLLVRGLSNPTIADQLCISLRTVETHRKNSYAKLNVHNVVELTTLALQTP